MFGPSLVIHLLQVLAISKNFAKIEMSFYIFLVANDQCPQIGTYFHPQNYKINNRNFALNLLFDSHMTTWPHYYHCERCAICTTGINIIA